MYPLPLFLTCVRITRAVDGHLDSLDLDSGDARNLLFYVASLVACELTGEVKPSAQRLLDRATPERLTSSLLNDCYLRALTAYQTLVRGSDRDIVARGPELARRLRSRTTRRLAALGRKDRRPITD